MKKADGFDYEEYKIYMNFINECKNKQYDETLVLHAHHIIPKHLCADNDILHSKENIVKISVDDHVKAHLLIANLYPEDTYEHISNLRSARFLNKKSIKEKDVLKKITDSYIGEKNPFYGKTHTEETRKKLSTSNIGIRKGKNYEEIYGVEKANLEKQKRAKKTRTAEEYRLSGKKALDTRKRRGLSSEGKNNPYAQPYLVNGVLFYTRKEVETHFGMAMVTIKKRFNVIKLKRENI
jgi:hypothetical protein